MLLSCDCDEWDGEGFGWRTQNYEGLTLQTKRRQRCRSCGKLIDIGEEVVKFDRFRYPVSNVEVEIYGEGEEIDIAPWYHCLDCGSIYMALAELGFCLYIGDFMQSELFEYRKFYSPEARWMAIRERW